MKNTLGKAKENLFVPQLLRPNVDQFTRITRTGYMLLHGVNFMERYVTTTYRLHEIHISAWSWYVTTTFLFVYKKWKHCKISIWSFQPLVSSLLTTSLLYPSVQGATVQMPRICAATLPLFLERTLRDSVFVSTYGLAAVRKDLRVEDKLSWAYHQSRMY